MPHRVRRPLLTRLIAGVSGLLAALIGAPATAQTASPQTTQGTHIGLVPPPGFERADGFPGFERRDISASILVNEFPLEAYGPMTEGMTPAAFAAKGLVMEIAAPLDGVDAPHVLMRGRQNASGLVVEKFLLVTQGPTATALVTANIPDFALRDGRISEAEIIAALASLRWADAPAETPERFILDERAGFAERLRQGELILYDDAQSEAERADAAIFILAPSLGAAPITDPAATSRHAFLSVTGVHDVTIAETGAETLVGRPTQVVVGDAIDAESGAPRVMAQWLVLLEGGGYVRLLGIGGASDPDERATYLATFKTIAQSLRLAE